MQGPHAFMPATDHSSREDSTLTPSSDNPDLAAELDRLLLTTVGVAPGEASAGELMQATAGLARRMLSERWVQTQAAERAAKARRVYYLSMEFLIGRTLSNALAALDLRDDAAAALHQHALQLEDVADREADAALGNGGLGRLAACFLDSMATLGLPSFGYGIRYEYGMFAQNIVQGRQVEHPDPWLDDGTPWEFPRAGISYPVRFGGWVEQHGERAVWRHAGEVAAKAYDMVVPGHGTHKVSTLRLWKAAAPAHIDLHAFNSGDYAARRRVEERVRKHLVGALPERQHAGRSRTAPAPGVLLRQRLAAGHPGPPPARTRRDSTTWPTRWRSTSTTPTRRSAWPS